MQFNDLQGSKMKMLNDRWQQIQHQIDRQKIHRQQSLQEQLIQLEQKVNNHRPLHQQKQKMLKDQMDRLKGKISIQHEQKAELENNLSKQLRIIEENLATEIQNERNERREQMENWIKQSDQKLLNICHAMEQIVTEKGQNAQALTERMRKKISDLQDYVVTEKKRRQQNASQLTQSIQKQLNRLYGELENERKTRQNTSKKIQMMIQQIQKKLEKEVEQQRKSRQQTNSALLLLLQQTCNKVQKAFY